MFTAKDKEMLGNPYFNIITENPVMYEVQSKNTGHYWVIMPLIDHIVWRFMPGIVLLCVSALSREGIGQGDAWLFVTLGVYLQAGQQMILFGAALFLAAVWILLFWRRDSVEKDRTLPFVPFVLAAYMGGCYYGWL